MKIPLRYRIAALTLLSLLPVVAVSLVALLRLATGYLWDEAEADATRLAETVRRATRHGMMSFDRREVEDTIRSIAEQQDVLAIRLYDGDGVLRLPVANGPPNLDLSSPQCTECHADPRLGPLAEGACTHWVNDTTLRLYRPILNEPTCVAADCHPSPQNERLLGVLEVDMDVSPIAAKVRSLRLHGLWWGAVVLGGAALPLLLAFGWAVERPLAESLHLVGEISRDNLSVRSRLKRSDEWGELLASFDSMVSSLQEARAELEALNRDLERQVQERTQELEKALEAVQESDRMKTEFLANVSHEFSTPLQGVIGFSELLLDGIDGDLTSAQRADVETILRSGRHLLRLVEDLLELARLEGRRRFLCVDRIRLADVVEDAIEVGRPLAEGRPVEIVHEEVPGCPTIMGDATALRRALTHLVENAVQQTEQGSVRVRVGPAENGHAEVTVEDTGHGMTGEELHSALVGFSSKGGGGGLSVGLALARRLVEIHGGVLRVESTPGVGTRATVVLPEAPPMIPDVTTQRVSEG